MHFVFRLPTAAEAEIIRHYVGLAKKAEYSDEVLAQKRELALRARLQIGQKTASDDMAGLMPAEAAEGEFESRIRLLAADQALSATSSADWRRKAPAGRAGRRQAAAAVGCACWRLSPA